MSTDRVNMASSDVDPSMTLTPRNEPDVDGSEDDRTIDDVTDLGVSQEYLEEQPGEGDTLWVKRYPKDASRRNDSVLPPLIVSRKRWVTETMPPCY